MSLAGQDGEMVLMASEILFQDASLKDLSQSFIFLVFSLFSLRPGQKALVLILQALLLDLLEVFFITFF